MRDRLKPQNLSFTEIAKSVGERWQMLSSAEKGPYEAQSAASKEKYTIEMTAYKKTAEYQEYVEYLADFKAKHPMPSSGQFLMLATRPRSLPHTDTRSTVSRLNSHWRQTPSCRTGKQR